MTLPRIARPDVGSVVVSEWQVGTQQRQRALVDASLAAWATLPWPDTLVSLNWLASTDGETVLSYVQWTSDEQFVDFVRTHRPTLAAAIGDAVEGVAPAAPVFYRLYRSGVRDDPPEPGCIVIVSVEFDGPDPQRQRAWVDTVFDALESETAPHPGGISGHFHVSTDGTRVLNYAEWVDEESHRDALARSGQGAIGSNPKWRDVQAFPGVKSAGVRRYRLDRSLVRPGHTHAA